MHGLLLIRMELSQDGTVPDDIQLLNLLVTLHPTVKHWLTHEELTKDAAVKGEREGKGRG